ncbi:hypothetical protein D3C77_818900 [compost metagenome]
MLPGLLLRMPRAVMGFLQAKKCPLIGGLLFVDWRELWWGLGLWHVETNINPAVQRDIHWSA